MKRKPAYTNIKQWVIQEKIEGMNMSVVVDPASETLELRGRTTATDYDFTKVDLPSRESLIESLDIKEGAKIILFGELCGGGIQKERYFEKPTFVLFDVQYVSEFHMFYLDPEAIPEVAKSCGLKSVPILGMTENMIDSKESLEGWITNSLITSSVKAEGIVAKPRIEVNDKFGERIIYKTRYAHFQ